MISFGFGAFTPTERTIEGLIDGHNVDSLLDYQIAPDDQIYHSNVHTPPPPREMNVENGGMNYIAARHEGNNGHEKNMKERIKALETFLPLNQEFRYNKHDADPTSFVSRLRVIATDFSYLWRGIDEIQKLCSMAEKYPSRVRFMAGELIHFSEEYCKGDRTLANGLLEKIIVDALEFLQTEDLEAYERLWTLSVLKILRFFSTIAMLNPIREDPNTSRICRGGLELFLLKADTMEMISAVTEALKRVELIVDIKAHLSGTERNIQTPNLIRIHDRLLLNKSMIKSGIIESLALQSMHHAICEATSDEELECLSNIMQHLESFYPVAQQFAITEGLKRVKLIMKIRGYLQDFDTYQKKPAIMDIYNKLLRIKSMDDALLVRSLALECLQYMTIGTYPDEDVEFVYKIMQYLETLDPSSQQLQITEPLERIQLIMSIRNYIHGTERDHQSPAIMDIHNTLLQTSSSDKVDIVQLMASQCIAHMVLEEVPEEEVQYFYHILKFFEKFHRSTIQPLIEMWLSISIPFRIIRQKFNTQAELQYHLQRYSEKDENDPYILSLLLPFVGLHSVDSSYVEHCLHILNIQDSALASKDAELYGLDVSKGRKYHEDQDFFIEMMYKVSTYTEGIQQYLNSHLKRNAKSGHFEFISPVPLATEIESSEKCQICLGGFLKGQRVLKLGCYRPHMFHGQCMRVSKFTHNNGYHNAFLIWTFCLHCFLCFWVDI
ncbi:hypothetical protein DFH28DRAFT_916202 [Melampsora americana]|nr:hypothetical protein DFH28DRAFT_916202 [Melampsora americana]